MIQSVRRATELLFLAAERGHFRISEAAEGLQVDRATASRLSATLAQQRLLTRDALGRYTLGPATAMLGTRFLERLDVRAAARKHLEALAEATHETVVLSLYVREKVLYIDIIQSERPVRIHAQIGYQLPIHCTGTSKAVLAFLLVEQREAILSRPLKAYTPYTVTDPQQLRAELEQIRRDGFAVSREELNPGVSAIGAPVFDSGGLVIGGVGIVGPTERVVGENLDRFTAAVKEAGDAISQELGFP